MLIVNITNNKRFFLWTKLLEFPSAILMNRNFFNFLMFSNEVVDFYDTKFFALKKLSKFTQTWTSKIYHFKVEYARDCKRLIRLIYVHIDMLADFINDPISVRIRLDVLLLEVISRAGLPRPPIRPAVRVTRPIVAQRLGVVCAVFIFTVIVIIIMAITAARAVVFGNRGWSSDCIVGALGCTRGG